MGTVRFGSPGGRSYGFSLDITPVVRKLLIANFAVWGAQIVFGLSGSTFFNDLFALHPQQVFPWRPWQLLTYMFLHSAPGPGTSWSIWHILMNSLLLAFMGGPVERNLGSKRFLRFYLICGFVGGVLNLLPPFAVGSTLGASGAVLGVLTAFGLLFPKLPIYVMFLFAVPAKYVVIFLGVVNVLSALNSNQDGVAYIVHVGGMASGYLLLRGMPYWQRWTHKVAKRNEEQNRQRRSEIKSRMDEILLKMHREGKENLTQEEWNTLLEGSRQRRED